MAVSNVKRVGIADRAITMPIVGMYAAKTKSGKAYTLYIDHHTNASPTAPRSYKCVPIVTKDTASLFYRLCKAHGVDPNGMTQLDAAEALAQAVAQKGAIRCVRQGKEHSWTAIQAIDYSTEAKPWCYPSKPGLDLKSLWEIGEKEAQVDDEDYLDTIYNTEEQ